MINFKQRQEVMPSALILGSVVILIVTLIYMLLVPKPSIAGIAAKHAAGKLRLTEQIDRTRRQEEQTRETVVLKLWTGNPDTIAGSALAQLGTEARQRMVSVGAFRPQHVTDVGGVSELPMTVQLTGSYANIHAVLDSIDSDNSKAVLKSVQLATSQIAGGGVVTATLGLSAYFATDPTLITAAPAKAAKPSPNSKSKEAGSGKASGRSGGPNA